MPNREINLYAHLFVYIDNKMAVVVDLTKQNATSFEGSSEEDINYATNFWQSIQLHPPMESRLVSSDIKQRLKVAPPSSQGKRIELRNEYQPEVTQLMFNGNYVTDIAPTYMYVLIRHLSVQIVYLLFKTSQV